MENIVLKNGRLTVEISPRGAELQSIVDENGVQRLYQGDSPFWSGRAPVLFPVAGGFLNDRYEMDGKTYDMPKHGKVRYETLEAENVSDVSVTFVCTKKFDGFPFDYAFRVRYTLVDNSLRVAYLTDNTGDTPFWFCVGGHEAYSTPEGIEAYEVVFERDEPLNSNILVGNLLSHEVTPIESHEGVMPLKYDYFAVDAIVFPYLASKSVTLRSKAHDRRIRVDFAGNSNLMFWTKPGAPYICIEPWTNTPDFVDHDGKIEHKRGAIRLMPGDRDVREHTITVL